MPKLTLEQKRRETLRRQLYGKEVSTPKVSRSQTTNANNDTNESKTFSMIDYSTSTTHSELLTTNYLSRDLTKILIFSSLAIATQISLFLLLQNHLVKLPF